MPVPLNLGSLVRRGDLQIGRAYYMNTRFSPDTYEKIRIRNIKKSKLHDHTRDVTIEYLNIPVMQKFYGTPILFVASLSDIDDGSCNFYEIDTSLREIMTLEKGIRELNPNVESIIGRFLTGKKGSTAAQVNKKRQNRGKSLAPRAGGSRKRRHKRRKTRKN